MISERLAPRARAVRAPHTWHERITPRFRQLAETLGQSVLIQLMLAMSFIAFAALLYMAQASEITVQQINIAVLRDARQQLIAQNAELQSQAVGLQSLQRIDTIATTRFHMTSPDITTAIWVKPHFVHVAAIRPVTGDIVAAERASSPLVWLEHAITTVHNSL